MKHVFYNPHLKNVSDLKENNFFKLPWHCQLNMHEFNFQGVCVGCGATKN